MSGSDEFTIAKLTQKEIETLQVLERKLGNDVHLLAVKNTAVLYALEAKIAPAVWKRVDHAYPEIEGLKAYYANHAQAKDAKAALKSLLMGKHFKTRLKKRPIRIREIMSSGKSHG
jgi:hypothetical protein